MVDYKLLTPGPLTTSASVKKAMLVDHCTWDDDYKAITRSVRDSLLRIPGLDPDVYTCVFMQGSGTFGVESMLTSLIANQDKVLIITNDKYGERLVEICSYSGKDYLVYECPYDRIPYYREVEKILKANEDISHVVMVHLETTTGILNEYEKISQISKDYGKVFLLDAMSSFGGIPIDFSHIDGLVSSANKCIQGVPGFSFIIVKKDLLDQAKGNAKSLSLDLYDQYQAMEDGKWRYTSPTHTLVAFAQALEEFWAEGGVAARNKRYKKNQEVLARGMEDLGFETYIAKDYQGPIITTFLYPEDRQIVFEDMYAYIKDRGYAIYPGKLTNVETFRIGSIGHINEEDMEEVVSIIGDYLKKSL